jgi:hypothetical protein
MSYQDKNLTCPDCDGHRSHRRELQARGCVGAGAVLG